MGTKRDFLEMEASLWLNGKSQNVAKSCLPNAVGKQPSIPLIYLGRKWTLNWWWWWWWWWVEIPSDFPFPCVSLELRWFSGLVCSHRGNSETWSSTLGTRTTEHKGCDWGMQVDWWLQPYAVFGHRFLWYHLAKCHRNKVDSTVWLYRDVSSHKIDHNTKHMSPRVLSFRPTCMVLPQLVRSQPIQIWSSLTGNQPEAENALYSQLG